MFAQTFKRLIATGSIAVLLFAQLAVAAYACPGIDGAAGAFAAVAGDEAMQIAMPGCEMNKGGQDKDAGNPNLCLQHCQAGDQSVQTLPHIPVPAYAAVPLFAIVEPVIIVQAGYELQLKTAWSVLVPLPPPLIRFGVLRI